jgi:putative membrane protein
VRNRLLFAAALLAIAVSGIAPLQREDWLLENGLVALCLPLVAVDARRHRLSGLAYGLLLAMLLLHEVGAHYTYSLVPYDAWLRALGLPDTAGLFGGQRNHYDRLVHAAFGVLLPLPLVERLGAVLPGRRRLRASLALALVLAASGAYEILEWAAALVFGGELGAAYVGMQGDVWDAQKDMALAALGAIAACSVIAMRDRGRGIVEGQSRETASAGGA